MAASLAAKLKSEPNVEVQTVSGGLGEFTVLIDQQEAVKTSRLWYPNPKKVLETVKAHLKQ